MENKKQPFELKIKFTAPEHEAKAFYEALLLVSNAWARHKRLEEIDCSLENLLDTSNN